MSTVSDSLSVRSSNPVLAWATALGVVGLALGGFVLSFQALRDLAIRSGIDPGLAFIWPLIVDGFIVVATAAAFALKRRGRRVTWYPWVALVLFSAISVAGNASHAMEATGVTVPLWVATAVSSVPAIALLIASHLLVVMIGGKPRPARKSDPAPVAAEAARAKAGTPLAPARRAGEDAAVEWVRPRAVVAPETVAGLQERLAMVVADGGQVTGALIARLEGVSERTGRRRLEQLRRSHPHLFGQLDAADVAS